MRVTHRVDKLRGNPHAAAGFTHRTFEHVADAQFAPDLLYVDRLAFVREAGIAGDDEEPADARECGDDLFDHAVSEILLLRVAAHVLKRQHRGRPARSWHRYPRR